MAMSKAKIARSHEIEHGTRRDITVIVCMPHEMRSIVLDKIPLTTSIAEIKQEILAKKKQFEPTKFHLVKGSVRLTDTDRIENLEINGDHMLLQYRQEIRGGSWIQPPDPLEDPWDPQFAGWRQPTNANWQQPPQQIPQQESASNRPEPLRYVQRNQGTPVKAASPVIARAQHGHLQTFHMPAAQREDPWAQSGGADPPWRNSQGGNAQRQEVSGQTSSTTVDSRNSQQVDYRAQAASQETSIDMDRTVDTTIPFSPDIRDQTRTTASASDGFFATIVNSRGKFACHTYRGTMINKYTCATSVKVQGLFYPTDQTFADAGFMNDAILVEEEEYIKRQNQQEKVCLVITSDHIDPVILDPMSTARTTAEVGEIYIGIVAQRNNITIENLHLSRDGYELARWASLHQQGFDPGAVMIQAGWRTANVSRGTLRGGSKNIRFHFQGVMTETSINQISEAEAHELVHQLLSLPIQVFTLTHLGKPLHRNGSRNICGEDPIRVLLLLRGGMFKRKNQVEDHDPTTASSSSSSNQRQRTTFGCGLTTTPASTPALATALKGRDRLCPSTEASVKKMMTYMELHFGRHCYDYFWIHKQLPKPLVFDDSESIQVELIPQIIGEANSPIGSFAKMFFNMPAIVPKGVLHLLASLAVRVPISELAVNIDQQLLIFPEALPEEWCEDNKMRVIVEATKDQFLDEGGVAFLFDVRKSLEERDRPASPMVDAIRNLPSEEPRDMAYYTDPDPVFWMMALSIICDPPTQRRFQNFMNSSEAAVRIIKACNIRARHEVANRERPSPFDAEDFSVAWFKQVIDDLESRRELSRPSSHVKRTVPSSTALNNAPEQSNTISHAFVRMADLMLPIIRKTWLWLQQEDIVAEYHPTGPTHNVIKLRESGKPSHKILLTTTNNLTAQIIYPDDAPDGALHCMAAIAADEAPGSFILRHDPSSVVFSGMDNRLLRIVQIPTINTCLSIEKLLPEEIRKSSTLADETVMRERSGKDSRAIAYAEEYRRVALRDTQLHDHGTAARDRAGESTTTIMIDMPGGRRSLILEKVPLSTTFDAVKLMVLKKEKQKEDTQFTLLHEGKYLRDDETIEGICHQQVDNRWGMIRLVYMQKMAGGSSSYPESRRSYSSSMESSSDTDPIRRDRCKHKWILEEIELLDPSGWSSYPSEYRSTHDIMQPILRQA